MITHFDGNVFNSDAEMIAHQVNCLGVMGAGVALEVKNRFPHVYLEYRFYTIKRTEEELLGTALFIDKYGAVLNYNEANKETSMLPVIANIYGQGSYGLNGLNGQFTNYDALEKGLIQVKHKILEYGWKLAIPYGIGCGLGGGDWDIVYPMIERIFKDTPAVEIWKLQ